MIGDIMFNCQQKAIESYTIEKQKEQYSFGTDVLCRMCCEVEKLATVTKETSEDSSEKTIAQAEQKARESCERYFLNRCEMLCDLPNSGIGAEEWYAHYRRIYNENEESKRLITKITNVLNDR